MIGLKTRAIFFIQSEVKPKSVISCFDWFIKLSVPSVSDWVECRRLYWFWFYNTRFENCSIENYSLLNVLHLFLATGESRTRRKEKTARIAPTGEYRTTKKFMLFAKLQARKPVQNSSVML